MVSIQNRLFIGAIDDCLTGTEQLAVIHACKSPCHQQAVGYRGSLASSHPNYLALQREHDLYLNIIDPPVPLFKAETFERFLAFSRSKYDSGVSLLIHCNQGESRAPSLALLFLAKHTGALPCSSYGDARQEFERLFPAYQPGNGIRQFLARNWNEIH
jgi:hypothetical protein